MKRVLFVTGTRADFGKLKSLIKILDDQLDFEVSLFVTGMHMQSLYGATYREVERCGCKNIFKFLNLTSESTMDLTLSKTIDGLSTYLKENPVDLIVVHGDRVEALAGAITGSLNNILVAHIEGGELSGTIDELIRHAISKLSHTHFVANEKAKSRLMQMGELEQSIFVIGSPDMDIMFSDSLPGIEEVKRYYEIPYDKYGIVMYHPVTTEYDRIEYHVKQLVDALLADTHNYIVIYPNNDLGSQTILKAYRRLKGNSRFRLIPSMRFEYFLSLLKNADLIVGNSSAGIREAPAYQIPCVNIGSRQDNRASSPFIHNCKEESGMILRTISGVAPSKNRAEYTFGKGNSAGLFLDVLRTFTFWNISKQKQFKDLNIV